MRITFLLPHAGMAGGIKVIAIYAMRLQRHGHEVTVISTPWEPAGRRGRAWAVLRRWLHKLKSADKPLDPSHLHGLDLNHVHIREMRPVVDADVPDGDVVVATWWETAPWVNALSASKGAKAYFVQDYGAHDGQSIQQVAATWKLPLRKIVISQWIMSLIEKHASGREHDVDYVPNAVDLEQFALPPRGKQVKPTVGFLYNSAVQKGCDVMVDAVRLARRTHPDLQVVAYGPWEPGGEPALPERTRFFNCPSDAELKNIYGACDAWLFGSRREGFGLPILEAMASRTPVIATPAGAAPELVGRGGGTLVKLDDPADMAAAIGRVANMTDAEWRAMSDRAYATVAGYTWEDATDLFEAALKRAAGRSRQPQLAGAAAR